MDDFLYGEPVSVQGLSVAPQTGQIFRTGALDLILGVKDPTATVTNGRVWLDGADVTSSFLSCMVPGSQPGGATFRCPVPAGILTAGDQSYETELHAG